MKEEFGVWFYGDAPVEEGVEVIFNLEAGFLCRVVLVFSAPVPE